MKYKESQGQLMQHNKEFQGKIMKYMIISA